MTTEPIGRNTSVHPSSSSKARRDMSGYDGKTNGEVCNVLRHFLLCRSCLWCASHIYYRSNRTDLILADNFRLCPFCLNESIDLMPLTPDENYTSSDSKKSGVIVEFKR